MFMYALIMLKSIINKIVHEYVRLTHTSVSCLVQKNMQQNRSVQLRYDSLIEINLNLKKMRITLTCFLTFISGELTVNIGPGANGRIGRSVIINCYVNGPEPSKVQWIKYINGNQENITIDGSKYSGGSTSSPNLIINSLNATDAALYECTASNKRGTVRSATNATVTVNCEYIQYPFQF